MSGLSLIFLIGPVHRFPSMSMRTQVPSPWLTSLTKRVVKMVCALPKLAVARPMSKVAERILVVGHCSAVMRKGRLEKEWLVR